MAGRWGILLGTAVVLAAQTQSTWYAAWEDGREAERQGRWAVALAAYERAASLESRPTARRIAYGSSLVRDYYPYARMARCRLELGDFTGAGAALARSEAQGEPERERVDLKRRLAAATRPSTEPTRVPVPVADLPAPAPVAQAPVPSAPSPQPPAPEARREQPPAVRMPLAPKPLPFEAPPQAQVVEPERPSPQPPPRGPEPQAGSSWPPAWLVVSGVGLLLGLGLFLRRRSAPAPPADPDCMGPYRLEGLLGRGGFASTYRAHHTGTGQVVALKVLHPFRQDNLEFLGRFRQEARLGALMDHPGIVRLVDPGPLEGPAWLAMEYVEGQRLDHYLAGRGPLPLEEALRLGREIAAAMAHAHGRGVVHRDLKPANIMLVEGRVKVMDFGIARQMDAETLTSTYAFLGTPLYAAPEAQMRTCIGPEADRYSLGILLFELLAGQPPFEGHTPFEILDHHRRTELPDLQALRPDVPPALADLVTRLCQKDPDLRPGDEEILAALGS